MQNCQTGPRTGSLNGHSLVSLSKRRRLLVAVLLALLTWVGVACGAAESSDSQPAQQSETETSQDSDSQDSDFQDSDSSDTLVVDDGTDVDAASESEGSSLSERTVALPPAPVGIPEPRDRITPVSITVEALKIDNVNILAAGVEQNGDMEVPPADEVGWYEYGPTPGESGAAVLAAHIAYNGENGVFLNLDDLAVGEKVDIAYSDGSNKSFVVTETQQYPKDGLPADRVFSRTGDASLVLITCGGDFNRSIRSYTDNVVVYADPL